MSKGYQLKIIETDDSHLEKLSDFLNTIFGKDARFSTDYLRWQYRDNPLGKVVGFDAFLGDELAAHYATIPVRWKIEGAERAGLLSLNTATSANHRGQGLFTKLAARTYEAAAEQGFTFVIGVANANSTPGFLRKLGFELIAPLDVHFSLSKLYRLSNIKDFQNHSILDDKTEKWRLNKPAGNYYSNTHSILSKAKPGIGAVLKKDNPKLQMPSQFYPIHLLIGLNESSGFRLKMPRKWQPSPLNLIFKKLDEKMEIPKPKMILFRAIDFDAY